MAVPYTFGSATSSIPLSQLDSNFATVITLGNTAIQLGNTVTTLNNMTLANVTISSGNVTTTNVIITTANVTTANITTAAIGTGTVSTSLTLSYGTANGVAYLNSSKVLTSGTAITFDGTNFATTGSVTSAGANNSSNLTFTGTGNRITGDFSNATSSSRVSFQSSTTNGVTYIHALPNGTSTNSGFSAFGNANPDNTNFMDISDNGIEARIRSGITGTGTYLPMTFYTGGSERMRLDTSGNLGIGTSSPSNRLQVGDGTADTRATFRPNSAFAIGVANGAGFAGWIGGSGVADNMVFSNSAGTERMRIDSSGNVGIGTNSPTNTSGYTTLQLNNATNGGMLRVTNGTQTYWNYVNSGGAFLGTLSADPLIIQTNNTERARIDSSGSVSTTGNILVATGQTGNLQLNGGAGFTQVVASGSATDISLNLYAKGASSVTFNTNGGVLQLAAAGLGYGTGSGGTVTQATSKSTAVTLNKPTGKITMNNAALVASGVVEFVFNNSLATNNDLILLTLGNQSGAYGNYNVWGGTFSGGGGFYINVKNISVSLLSDALVINFAIIKGATS